MGCFQLFEQCFQFNRISPMTIVDYPLVNMINDSMKYKLFLGNIDVTPSNSEYWNDNNYWNVSIDKKSSPNDVIIKIQLLTSNDKVLYEHSYFDPELEKEEELALYLSGGDEIFYNTRAFHINAGSGVFTIIDSHPNLIQDPNKLFPYDNYTCFNFNNDNKYAFNIKYKPTGLNAGKVSINSIPLKWISKIKDIGPENYSCENKIYNYNIHTHNLGLAKHPPMVTFMIYQINHIQHV